MPVPASISLTAADAVSHDLPPISIRADASEAGMMISPFPGGTAFLEMQGPPGGTLFFVVKSVNGERTMKDIVRAEEKREISLGPAGTVRVGGTAADAQVYFTGQQAAATAGCVVRLPVGSTELLLHFGAFGKPGAVENCRALAELRPFKRLLDSFRAEWSSENREALLEKAKAAPSKEPRPVPRHESPSPEPRRDQPEKPVARAGPSAKEIQTALGAIETEMRNRGVWIGGMPDAAEFARWDDFRMQMYSFQSTLQAMSDALNGAAGMDADAAAGLSSSVLGSVRSLLETLETVPSCRSFAREVSRSLARLA